MTHEIAIIQQDPYRHLYDTRKPNEIEAFMKMTQGVIGLLQNVPGIRLRGYKVHEAIAPPDPRLIGNTKLLYLQRMLAGLGLMEHTDKINDMLRLPTIREAYAAVYDASIRPDSHSLEEVTRLGKILAPLIELEGLLQRGLELTLDKVLNDVDVDLKLPVGVSSETLIRIWKDILRIPLGGHIEIGGEGRKLTYGIKEFTTRSSGIPRLSVGIQDEYPESEPVDIFRADFMGNPENGGVDLRRDGISTDAIFADHKIGTLFEINEASIPQDKKSKIKIRFLNKKVYQNPEFYMILASRAVMQSTWHEFAIEIPDDMPQLTPEIVTSIFEKKESRRKTVVEKLIDGFLMDPKQAFYLCWKLGLWKASPIMNRFSDEQILEMINQLPNKEEHIRLLESNRGKMLGDEIYSCFKLMIQSINKALDMTIDPNQDWHVFYNHLFPKKDRT